MGKKRGFSLFMAFVLSVSMFMSDLPGMIVNATGTVSQNATVQEQDDVTEIDVDQAQSLEMGENEDIDADQSNSDLNVSSMKIQYKDKNGNWQNLTAGTLLEEDTQLQMEVSWNLRNGSSDNQYIVDLEDITENINFPNVGIQDYILDGKKVAEYRIEGNKFILDITDPDYRNQSSGRYGTFGLNGTVSLGGKTYKYNEPYEIGLKNNTILVKYDDGSEAGVLSATKTLDGAMADDGTQKYKVTIKATKGDITNITITDTPGNGLSNASAITVINNGGTGIGATYGSISDLNSALNGKKLEKDQTIELTYTMKADISDIYKQNNALNYENKMEISGEDSHGGTQKQWPTAKISVNKPSVGKTGKVSEDGTKVTWEIEISLGKFDQHDAANTTSDQLRNELSGLITHFKDQIPAGCTQTDLTLDDAEITYNSGKYKLTYTTAITSDYQNKTDKTDIENNVSFDVQGNTYKTTGKAQTLGKSWLKKELIADSYDPKTQTVQWKVTLTDIPQNITNVILQDYRIYSGGPSGYTNKGHSVKDISVEGVKVVENGNLVPKKRYCFRIYRLEWRNIIYK